MLMAIMSFNDIQLFILTVLESDSFSNYPNRVILQIAYLDIVLNGFVQVHFLDSNKFEITFFTAMCIDIFKMAIGQCRIDIKKIDLF